MSFVRSSGNKFAQLVADHVLSDENGNVLSTVVYGDRVSNHVGDHCGSSRPSFDLAFVAAFVHFLDLFVEVFVYEESFFNTSCHIASVMTFALALPGLARQSESGQCTHEAANSSRVSS